MNKEQIKYDGGESTEQKNYPLEVEFSEYRGYNKDTKEYYIYRRYTALNTSFIFNQGNRQDMEQIANKFNFNGIIEKKVIPYPNKRS